MNSKIIWCFRKQKCQSKLSMEKRKTWFCLGKSCVRLTIYPILLWCIPTNPSWSQCLWINPPKWPQSQKSQCSRPASYGFFLDSNCCWSMIESQPIGWWNPMNLHWNPILVPHYWCLDQHLPIKCVFHSVLPGEIPFLLPHYRSMIPCRISWFIRIFYLQPKARILIYPSLYFLISILHCIYCIPWGCLLISLYPQKIGLRIVRPRIFRPTPELPSSGHSDDHSSIETYGVLGDSLCPLRIPKIHHKVLWFYWQTNLSASFHHKYDKWWLNMIKHD